MRVYILAALVAAPNPGAAAAGAVKRVATKSGISVLVAPHPGASAVAVQAWIGVGAADERKRERGMAHALEHMLFKGTARRGVGAVAAEVEAAGGDINAWTSFDDTVIHAVTAARHLDVAVDVLGDAVAHSIIDPDELEREREVILEEIRQAEDDPLRKVAQGLFATTFRRHPYGRSVIGAAEPVRSIGRAELLEFRRRWYTTENTTVVVAGDVEPESTAARIERAFRGLASGGAPRRRRATEARQDAPRARVLARDVSEGRVAVGLRLPPLRSRDTAALDLLSVILGQGESSRLGAELHRQRQLITDGQASVHALRDHGLFVVMSSAVPERVDEGLEAVLEAMYRLAHERVGEEELGMARRAIEADAIYDVETVEGHARKLGSYASLLGDPLFEARYLQTIATLTPDDLRDAAQRWLRPEGTSVSAVLPPSRSLSTQRGLSAAQGRIGAAVERASARAMRRSAPVALIPRGGKDERIVEELPSGATAIIERDSRVPLVAARAVWTGGLRLERRQNNGISSLTASLLTRGCGERSADDVIRDIEASAASLTGFAGRSSLGLRGEWLARDWEQGFELMAECVTRPRFSPEEVEREKRRALEDLAVRGDSPSSAVFRAFLETLYRKHPYHLDVLGREESVAVLGAEQIRRYYRRSYPISRLTVAIVGDVDPARALVLLRERFGDARRRAPAARTIVQPRFDGRSAEQREAHRYMDREQSHLVIGFPGLEVDDPDRHALEVLSTILGGQGGRLFLELRDRRALAYRVAAYSVEGLDPGYVAIYLACGPDKLREAVLAVRAEIDRLREEGIAPEDVERASRYLIGTHEISLQRRSSVAASLAFHHAYGLGLAEHDGYARAIGAVTSADVERVAARLFDWDCAVTATVSPPSVKPAASGRGEGSERRAPRRSRSR